MSMTLYTGWQWLLIDAANNFGLDKLTFEDRIAWATQHLTQLEVMAGDTKTRPLYLKAVMAIRKAQRGIPTGHMVGVDACCSGIQVMSALTGCVAGATSTGMVDPNVRADAYSLATQVMNADLASQGLAAVQIDRADAKQAIMTSFYGSKAEPKAIFGDDTPELEAFYQAAMTIAPGPWELLQDLLGSWQAHALLHSWMLPDGYDARVKVMKRLEARIEVDELDHASFTYEFFENTGSKSGLANAANVTHSMDAYVLREMHRRCNYDRDTIQEVRHNLKSEFSARNYSYSKYDPDCPEKTLGYYLEQYQRSGLASAVILPHITTDNLKHLSDEHLDALSAMADGMLQYQPFPLVTVHDEFKCHSNNVNWVRWNYKEILADIAESDVLDDLLSQIVGYPVNFHKRSFNLGPLIRGSNYALC